mmetsp:Transcript_5349/g.11748  ORF Transcript_5349/g.11748 Transcript_5349/m.11748 type:complete len:431 (+) Transcript_5349:180-1472(+)
MSTQGGSNNMPVEVAVAISSTFHCSICMELMYKPCVNTCGHSFCFWCMHRAMNAFDTSHACPLCRAPFRHLPAVCAPLHSFLARTFPDEMKGREEETKKLEVEEYHADSPAVVVPSMDCSFDVREAFECRDCHSLAVPPTVLTCGHVVCSGGPSSTSSSENKAILSRRKKHCPVPGCVGKMAAEAAARGGGPASAKCCALIDEILRDHISEREYREAAAASSRLCGGLRSEDVASPHGSETTADANIAAAAVGGEASISSSFGPNESVILAGLTSASGSRLNGMRAVVGSFSRTTDRYNVKIDYGSDATPKEYQVKPKNLLRCVHYGVGCDGCGVYPIAGRRYKCLDCAEDIGFDLCGECCDDDVHKRVSVGDGNAAAGRFNQQHRPNHSMEEIEQYEDSRSLQCFQARNPELSMHQIMAMLGAQSSDEG